MVSGDTSMTESRLEQQRLGSHLSIAGGVHNALESAISVGCDCVQIFVKSQQQWSASPLDPDKVERWRKTRRQCGVRPVIAHAAYLINLASPDRAMWRKGLNALVDEIRRCQVLGIGDLVLHPGSHRGAGLDKGIRQIVRALDHACEQTQDSGVRILLETMAGQGDGVGSRFEDLSAVIADAKYPRRIAVCFDTCHVFAAGYELRTPEGYAQTMAELRRHIGLRRLRCIHVNDSKRPLGSRVDRHEHIGKGKLGLPAFRLLMNDARLARIPKILETPKGVDSRGRDLDKTNLAKLRRLIGQGE